MKIIDEGPIWDPRDDIYRLGAARAFFGLPVRDPYTVADSAKSMYDKLVSAAELVELRAALDEARAQAVINRRAIARSDGCQMRSVTYPLISTRTAGYWTPPASIGPPDEPSRIDYVIAPGVPRQQVLAVLSAIEQYPVAVAAQDALGRYPAEIVPHDPGDPRPPTITFTQVSGIDAAAQTVVSKTTGIPGVANRWISGTIELTHLATPPAVGHEIGHVLGLDHLPRSASAGTMKWQLDDTGPWDPSIPLGDPATQAFDDCMFLPPIENVFFDR
ncbi:hypothetical protein N1031_03710 [Herbiconiux moechotypicola]|uniref:hypothetical protein n=1 Tax=Herbiconiux moechotypicola TaxID=637393 RepID=UPI00217DE268|nr:hypothetical protein [Herbiconiux moechotypicola]MCS5728857.1 hypothetical protein [Herbiconiux moechotypicola]